MRAGAQVFPLPARVIPSYMAINEAAKIPRPWAPSGSSRETTN